MIPASQVGSHVIALTVVLVLGACEPAQDPLIQAAHLGRDLRRCEAKQELPGECDSVMARLIEARLSALAVGHSEETIEKAFRIAVEQESSTGGPSTYEQVNAAFARSGVPLPPNPDMFNLFSRQYTCANAVSGLDEYILISAEFRESSEQEQAPDRKECESKGGVYFSMFGCFPDVYEVSRENGENVNERIGKRGDSDPTTFGARVEEMKAQLSQQRESRRQPEQMMSRPTFRKVFQFKSLSEFLSARPSRRSPCLHLEEFPDGVALLSARQLEELRGSPEKYLVCINGRGDCSR